VDCAVEQLVQLRAGALMIATDPVFLDRRERLVALTAGYRIPAIYGRREYTALGGLMSYGTSLADAYRQIGTYVGRIVGGIKPAGLPVMQANKFRFVGNLKACKGFGARNSTEAAGLRRRGDRINLLQCECPLLAQSGHVRMSALCPL